MEVIIESEKDVSLRSDLRELSKKMLADEPAYTRGENSIYRPIYFQNVFASKCYSCEKISIWLKDALIYPEHEYVIEPNADLTDDALSYFKEASAVFKQSPRASAALLRLAVEKLCLELGKSGDINEMIGAMVTDGLSAKVQRALDVVRVVGNESVHPGTIDVGDTPEVALQLFKLVNIIAEQMITEPRHIDELYESLPLSKLKGIEDRNKKSLAIASQNRKSRDSES